MFVQEEFRRPIVIGGPQVSVASAEAVAAGKLIRGFSSDPIGGGVPSLIPAVIVAGFDAGGRRENFPEQSATVFRGAECALRLKPKLSVVREKRRLFRRRGAHRSATRLGIRYHDCLLRRGLAIAWYYNGIVA